MPTFFKINRPIGDELLAHIQAHPKVTSAVRTNAGQPNEFTTVTLDANYTPAQIRSTAIDYILTKQQDIMNRIVEDIKASRSQEYEV